MLSVKQKIENFLREMQRDEKVFKFLYNLNHDDFDSDKDWVYYSGPYWDAQEISGLFMAVMSGKWITSGEHVARFEMAFSKKTNQAQSLMVNSGSSANLVMMAAVKKQLRWKDGDEVILSVVGFPTTLAPIIQNGLKPVFADIDFSDLNFNLDEVEAKITKRTKAILLSPVLGNPPDMARIVSLCQDKNITLLLDGCDSLGTKWDGKDLPEFAYASTCSFYPAHHISTGEGGMVSSNDSALIKTARSISWWGRDCYCVGAANLLRDGTCKNRFCNWIPDSTDEIDHKYYFTNIGYNLKPLDLQGAIGLAQIAKMDDIHRIRRKNKAYLQSALERHIPFIRLPDELPSAETSWFGVPVVCDTREQKIELVQHLEGNRIQTRPYFAGNILRHPAYNHLGDAKNFPEADKVLGRVFFVGCSPTINQKMLEYISSVLEKFPAVKKEKKSA